MNPFRGGFTPRVPRLAATPEARSPAEAPTAKSGGTVAAHARYSIFLRLKYIRLATTNTTLSTITSG